MTMYAYKGVGPTGKPVSGLRDSDSPKGIRQLLRKDGIVVTSCEISTKGAAGAAAQAAGLTPKKGLGREVDLGGLLGGVKKTEIGAFTRQLSTLLKAGIPLSDSLGALLEQTQNLRFKVPIGQIHTAVKEGTAFADALGKHPKLFDELFVSMVRAGEVAGNLDEVLVRLADFMDSSQKLKSRVQSAMIYPLIMVIVGAGIITLIMTAVVPEITHEFAQQGKTLPWNTRALIWFSDLFRNHWLLGIVGIISMVLGFRAWVRSDNGKIKWHTLVLKMPLVGPLVRTVSVSRFCRTLGTMLQAGVPMLKGLDIAKQIVGNVIIRKTVDDAKKAVSEGESLAATLKRSGQFPPTTVHMIAIGERAGQLESMLGRVADTYDNEIETKLGRLTTMLEPLRLVFMGGAVAFIVFSVMQPILDMGSFVKH